MSRFPLRVRARKLLESARFRLWKRLSGSSGLPDFLIIGAQKSATCTLYFNLRRHPKLHLPETGGGLNEVHFFDWEHHWERGVGWYREQFEPVAMLQGEKTPEYISQLKCHARMHATVPRARLILSLRNPVDRAYSHWNHFNQIHEESQEWGWIVRPFEEAIESTPDIVRRGDYIDQVEHLLRFYPRQQLHVVIAERLRKNPGLELNRICDFLGVEPLEWEVRSIHQRSYAAPMSPEARQRLKERYAASNARLFEFLGERITEWED
ncbi:MAG: sulfotransferase domain-containing protein [Planctomycetota bacterium]